MTSSLEKEAFAVLMRRACRENAPLDASAPPKAKRQLFLWVTATHFIARNHFEDVKRGARSLETLVQGSVEFHDADLMLRAGVVDVRFRAAEARGLVGYRPDVLVITGAANMPDDAWYVLQRMALELGRADVMQLPSGW